MSKFQASAPGIFAAGDIARWPDPHSGEAHSRRALGRGPAPRARRRPAISSRCASGSIKRRFFWSAHYDLSINYVGHAEKVGPRRRSSGDAAKPRRGGQVHAGRQATGAGDVVSRPGEPAQRRSKWSAGSRDARPTPVGSLSAHRCSPLPNTPSLSGTCPAQKSPCGSCSTRRGPCTCPSMPRSVGQHWPSGR